MKGHRAACAGAAAKFTPRESSASRLTEGGQRRGLCSRVATYSVHTAGAHCALSCVGARSRSAPCAVVPCARSLPRRGALGSVCPVDARHDFSFSISSENNVIFALAPGFASRIECSKYRRKFTILVASEETVLSP